MRGLLAHLPGGMPGAGLFLLRAVLGLVTIAVGVCFADGGTHPLIGAQVLGLLALFGGACLIVGFLTPLASGLAGAVAAAPYFSATLAASPCDLSSPHLLAPAVAIALIFLGPGRFSLDARLFGRREIIIPRAPRPQ